MIQRHLLKYNFFLDFAKLCIIFLISLKNTIVNFIPKAAQNCIKPQKCACSAVLTKMRIFPEHCLISKRERINWCIFSLGFLFYLIEDKPKKLVMPKGFMDRFIMSKHLGRGAGGVVHLIQEKVKNDIH